MSRMESPAERGAVLLRRRWVRVLLWVALAVVVVMIFVFSAQSGEASGSLSAFLTKFIIRTVEGGEAAETAQPGVMLFVEKLVRKAAHVTEFALLGFLLRLQAGAYALRRPTRWCFLAGMIRAALDEVHQLFVPGRGGMWQDVLLDGCGVLAGIVLAYTALVITGRLLARFGGKKDEQA